MVRAIILATVVLLGVGARAEALRVVSPSPGATVTPGQLVTLRLALDPGESATEVGVFTDGKTIPATQDGTAWVAEIRVPTEAVGPDLLIGYAILTGGGVAFADVAVNVDAGALRSLFVSVPMRFTFAGETAGVEVRGLFTDGVLRDLSLPVLGTTYSSSAPTVLAVDPSGVVQARETGDATLTVSSRGRTATVKIQVRIAPNDTNRIPVITAGPDQTVGSEERVVLSATATDADGDAVEYLWEQISGRVVTLHNPRSANPEFASPRTTGTMVLEFLVSARDAKGATTLPVVVRVTVNPLVADHD